MNENPAAPILCASGTRACITLTQTAGAQCHQRRTPHLHNARRVLPHHAVCAHGSGHSRTFPDDRKVVRPLHFFSSLCRVCRLRLKSPQKQKTKPGQNEPEHHTESENGILSGFLHICGEQTGREPRHKAKPPTNNAKDIAGRSKNNPPKKKKKRSKTNWGETGKHN